MSCPWTRGVASTVSTFWGGIKALSALQTRYATHNSKFGLKRGLKGSKADHTEIQNYYAITKAPMSVIQDKLEGVVKLGRLPEGSDFSPNVFLEQQEARLKSDVKMLFQATLAKSIKKIKSLTQQNSDLKNRLTELENELKLLKPTPAPSK